MIKMCSRNSREIYITGSEEKTEGEEREERNVPSVRSDSAINAAAE